ncbi:replicase [Poplar mosaic virus]|uniref:Replicase n=1 Tax=Poplar mosaic virus TaxID=12166 RepID=Q6RBY9_9VIRU|nr:replicase [Poplar mosaic virus]AAR89414.1 replicase [Poplar mosaic virus]
MALTYRSPIEEMLNSFTTIEQSLVSATALQGIRKEENNNYENFSYALPVKSKEKLVRSGIYLSPYSAMPHSHPVCKTLENYMLYRVLPGYLDSSFYFVGIKNSKLDFIKQRNSTLSMTIAINRYVTSADKLRYGSEFTCVRSKQSGGLLAKHGGFSSETLSTLVPSLISVKARKLFIHDELHYWSKNDLRCFLQVVKPEMVLATLVYPPELLAGSKISLNPWCYEFDIYKDRLLFYPDGVRSEGYNQPVGGGYLLKTSRIVLPNGDVYCVDLIHSKFAHHVIAITRGDRVVPCTRTFGDFDAISVESLVGVCGNVQACYPISYSTVSKIYRYLQTLVKPDGQSAMAKLGQIVAEPTGHEVKFVQDFSRFVIGTHSISSIIMPDYKKKIAGFLAGLLPHFASRMFAAYREVTLDNFISTLRPFSFIQPLSSLDESLWDELHFYDMSFDIEAHMDTPSKMDESFKKDGKKAIPDRDGEPYSMLVDAQSGHVDYIELEIRNLVAVLARYIARSFGNSQVCEFSFDMVADACKNVLLRSQGLGWLLLHELGREVIEMIQRKAGAYCAHLRVTFSSGSSDLTWFLSRKRGCRLYIKDYYHGAYFDHSDAFSAVLEDIQRWKIPAIKEGLPLVREIEVVAPTDAEMCKLLEERLKDPNMPPTAVSAEACACGANLGLGVFEGAEFVNILMPDKVGSRKCGWYSMDGSPYSYNGGSHTSQGWPEWIDVLLTLNGVGQVGYDCLLAQEYAQGGKLGFHRDDEPNLDVGASIFTVNLYGEATFMLKGKGHLTKLHLRPSQCFTMPHGFQESHKHAVEGCSKGRVSLTFRVLKKRGLALVRRLSSPEPANGPEGDDSSTASSAEADDGAKMVSAAGAHSRVPTVRSPMEVNYDLYGVPIEAETFEGLDRFKRVQVPGDGYCFWHSIGFLMGLEGTELKKICKRLSKDLIESDLSLAKQYEGATFAEAEVIASVVHHYDFSIQVYYPEDNVLWNLGVLAEKRSTLLFVKVCTLSPWFPKNDCVITATVEALGRSYADVFGVLSRVSNSHILAEVNSGEGVSSFILEEYFKLFGIQASIIWDGELICLNEIGREKKAFEIVEGHMTHLPARKAQNMPQLLSKNVEVFSRRALSILRKAGTEIHYNVSRRRACELADSLLQGSTGAICSATFNLCGSLIEHVEVKDHAREVTAVLGTFGAGKSRLFKEFISKSPGRCVTFVSPRKALAEAVKTEIFGESREGKKKGRNGKRDGKSANWNVFTFEVFLKMAAKSKPGQVVIIDEVQLYPPGYLDLALTLMRSDVNVFVVGDPCQSDYDSEKDRAVFEGVPSDISRLLANQTYKFVCRSRRFKNEIFIGRLPCKLQSSDCELREEYYCCSNFEDVDSLAEPYRKVFLVSSFDEKRIIRAHYPDPGVQCLTFGESTGMTFKYGTILITPGASKVNERRWLTCLSRFAYNVAFLNMSGVSYPTLVDMYSNRALGKFFCGRAGLDDLLEHLPGDPNFEDSFQHKIGKAAGLKEEKVAGDPWLKCMLDLSQEEDMEAEEVYEICCAEPWFKTHLPRSELESIRAGWVHKIMEKEAREVRIKDLITNQFTDQHSKNHGVKLTNAAERFETIYPRHRASDTATFLMAVKKRLRFSKPHIEMAKLREAELFGESMLKLFLKHVPLKEGHNCEFMERANRDFELKKTSKSAATIENHAQRSCRDWLADVGLVFMKSQLCTKWDNRFRNAKAAQSIVCFQHAVLCRFAPYMRYIEMKLNEVLPPNFYIHSGKSLEELDAWVKRYKFSGVCTESDYEAFDASQDQYIMAFELAVMKHLRLPADLIEDYKYIKTHLGSKLGSFAIMRFSGEASTFLFNTMANMLFTFMRYDMNGSEAVCFAGDDMCASKHLRVQSEHDKFLDKLKLKAKVQFTEKPTFCGWNLCPDGIYKKPQLVLERMCIARETNNLANCIDNYAIEVAFAYKMGERATNRMSEEELNSHYSCVRTIVQNKTLIKSDVWGVFSRGSE